MTGARGTIKDIAYWPEQTQAVQKPGRWHPSSDSARPTIPTKSILPLILAGCYGQG